MFLVCFSSSCADEGDNLWGNPNKYILKGENKLSQGRKYLTTGIVCKTVTGTDYTNWSKWEVGIFNVCLINVHSLNNAE
jgi:hypothetical protein